MTEAEISKVEQGEAFRLVQAGEWDYYDFDRWLFYFEEKALHRGIDYADSRPASFE